jgi:hypothetical protein
MAHRATRSIALAALAVAASFALAPAHAETKDDMSFSGMLRLDRIDANKDRMVSRAEFLDQMGKVWDMKMKEMKVTRDRVSEDEFRQVLMYLRAGS